MEIICELCHVISVGVVVIVVVLPPTSTTQSDGFYCADDAK